MTLVQKIMHLFARHHILMLAIIGVIILRFLLLSVAPPGFYLDEAASGAHVIAMLAHGTNAHGESWPLFSASLGGGYTTPIYLYPLTAWAYVFGASEYALRAFSLTATVAAAGLLAIAMRHWLNNKTALIAGLVALTLPWGWIQGSIAWDTAIVPLFSAAAILGMTIALKADSARRRFIATASIGVSLILLAYLYPPCRISAPLLLGVAYLTLILKKRVSVRAVLLLLPIFALLCAPLLQFMLQPEALERSGKLSVFHDASLIEGVGQMTYNFLLILNPLFLFIDGDDNLRHATGPQGMLGFASLPAIVAVCYIGVRRLRTFIMTKQWTPSATTQLVALSIIGILISTLGSALTSEGQPHSLRATAAWPFFAVLITIGWLQLWQHTQRPVRLTVLCLALLTTSWYVTDLTFSYPDRAKYAFDVPVRQALQSGQPTPGYPSLSLFYYENR